MSAGGYVRRYAPNHPRADSRSYVPEHVLVAEAAVGYYLPRSVKVHHFNLIRTDNANTNLVVCENEAYHVLLHVRQRVADAGGDPNKDKICSHCKIPKEHKAFRPDRNTYDGMSTCCRECRVKHYDAKRNRVGGHLRRRQKASAALDEVRRVMLLGVTKGLEK